jgi:hypothetical protein
MFERPSFTVAQRPLPSVARRTITPSVLLLSVALILPCASAQTAPPKPAQPAPTPPASAQPAPAQAAPATPAPAKAATTPAAAGTGALSVSSALAVEVSGAVKGRIILCPKGLKLSGSAVCLYAKNTLPALRSLLRGKLSGRIASDWKTSAASRSSSLIVKSGTQNAFVLLAEISPTETLVVLDSVTQTVAAAPAARPATPAGIVKGAQYVLDSDLKGLVNVAAVGGGTYRMASVSGGPVLTVTSGKKTATLGGGNVELPLAPISDGKNLIFPIDALRALACTVTPAQVGVTVACGAASASIRPIVF